MDKKILINAQQPDEKRVAIVEGQKLTDFYIEIASAGHLKGNIYKGVITALDKGLQAAFVNFGPEKNGFLPFREIMPESYKTKAKGKNPLINDVMAKGQEIMVQVEHDARGTKGAKLTNHISLPGRYIVMIPGRERLGVSRKIEDRDARGRLKDAFKGLKLPKEMGFILRTAGADSSTDEMAADLKYLTKLLNRIKRDYKKAAAPSLIYKEEDIAVRTVRDYLGSEVNEVIIDDKVNHRLVKNFLKLTMPWRSINITLYKDKEPIFGHFGLDTQITALGDRQVDLPSGGSIVIDRAEALTAIDVNSGRAKEKNTEALALKTNMEAAEEVARQLRLRDIGGLIVIDFIDLEIRKNYTKIEECLREALNLEKAHFDTTRISKFGMLEMSRERMRTAYSDVSRLPCQACSGSGVVKSPGLVANETLRQIQAIAAKGELPELACRLPVDSANYMMNQLRDNLAETEKALATKITIVADPALTPGQFMIEGEGLPEPITAETKHPDLAEENPSKAKKKKPRRRRKKSAPRAAGDNADADATTEASDATDSFNEQPDNAISADGEDPEKQKKLSASKKRRARRAKSRAKKKTADGESAEPVESAQQQIAEGE